MQSRLGSAVEACINVAVGFGVSWGANLVILPAFGYPVSAGDAFWMGVAFTVLSLVRSYALRRLFNRLHRGR